MLFIFAMGLNRLVCQRINNSLSGSVTTYVVIGIYISVDLNRLVCQRINNSLQKSLDLLLQYMVFYFSGSEPASLSAD
jgi:hypothetical protein